MDINIHISGLEPLANAISKLADAYSGSAQIAQDAISKASGKGGKKNAAKEEPATPAPESAAPAASASTAESPAATTQETSTVDSPAAINDAQAGGEQNPTPTSTSETPTSDQASSAPTESATAPAAPAQAAGSDKLTDEALRALAGEKAKSQKDKVKELVAKYAQSVSQIPADKREEFRSALEAL